MRKKYDFAFSLGATCPSTEVLRKLFLQHASFPFDWLFGSTFLGRIDILLDHFEHWLDIEDLEKKYTEANISKDAYYNKRTGITFNHDFPAGVPLAESLPLVVEKYRRRIDRLFYEIERANSILVLWTEAPHLPAQVTDEMLIEGQRKLQAQYPNKIIDIVCLSRDTQERHVTVSPHIRHHTFDYFKPGTSVPWAPSFRKIFQFMRPYRLRFHTWKKLKTKFWEWKKKRVKKH